MYDEVIKIDPKYTDAYFNKGLYIYILSIANSLFNLNQF